MLALDMIRLEAGLILLEVDYTSSRHALVPEQSYSPFEIGLGRLVALDKADFVGRRRSGESGTGGPSRRLVGVQLAWYDIERSFSNHGLPPAISASIDRAAVPVYAPRGDRQVGKLTSHGWSPILKQAIGLASVSPAYEAVGSKLAVEWTVEGHRGRVNAEGCPAAVPRPPTQARLTLMSMSRALIGPLLALVVAIGAGLAIGYMDSRPGWDDTGITAGALAIAALVAVLIDGSGRVVRVAAIAVLVGIWIPIFEMSTPSSSGSLLAFVFSAVGVFVGWASSAAWRARWPASPGSAGTSAVRHKSRGTRHIPALLPSLPIVDVHHMNRFGGCAALASRTCPGRPDSTVVHARIPHELLHCAGQREPAQAVSRSKPQKCSCGEHREAVARVARTPQCASYVWRSEAVADTVPRCGPHEEPRLGWPSLPRSRSCCRRSCSRRRCSSSRSSRCRRTGWRARSPRARSAVG